MSELPGVPVTPSSGEPAPFKPTFPEPPVVQPPVPTPGPEPAPTPSPEGPDSGALPGFDKLALLILILALVLVAAALRDFLNWLFRTMLGPLWQRTGSKQLETQPLAQALGSALGPFAHKIDPEMGTAFTQIATTTGTMSRAYVALANRILKLAVVISTLERQAAAQTASGAALRHSVQVQGAQQHAAVQTLQTQVKKAQASTRDTSVEVHALTEHITTRIEPELDRLKGRIPQLEQGQVTTTKRVAEHDRLLGLGAMVGTVAAAMGALGAGWTRCDTNRQVGEAICGSNPSVVRKLLKGTLDLLGIAELCTMVGLIASAGKNPVLLEGLGAFSAGVEDLLGCTGATRPRPLAIPEPSLGPLTAFAELAPPGV